MRQGKTRIMGGLIVGICLCTWPCQGGPQALPDSRLGIRTAPLLLLTRTDVQADLGMSPAQVEDVLQAVSSIHARAAELKGMKGVKALAGRRSIDEEQRKWIESRLSEVQRKRIVQIDLQWEGPAALVTRPGVADALDLSDEQRTKLKQAVAEFARRRSLGEAIGGIEAALARQTLETLAGPQRESWKAMLGRPFQPRLADSQSGQPVASTANRPEQQPGQIRPGATAPR